MGGRRVAGNGPSRSRAARTRSYPDTYGKYHCVGALWRRDRTLRKLKGRIRCCRCAVDFCGDVVFLAAANGRLLVSYPTCRGPRTIPRGQATCPLVSPSADACVGEYPWLVDHWPGNSLCLLD